MTLLRPALSPARYLALILVLGAGAALAGYAFFLSPPSFEPDVPAEVRARPLLPDAPKKAQRRISLPVKPQVSGRSETGNELPPAATTESSPYALTRAAQGSTSSQAAWVLDVLTTARREEADRIFDRLLDSPYQVYAYTFNQSGHRRYRVRVGFFVSRRQAEKAGRILVQKYKLPIPRAGLADAQERARFVSPAQEADRRPRMKP
jgi:hypothetical protein